MFISDCEKNFQIQISMSSCSLDDVDDADVDVVGVVCSTKIFGV